MRGVQRDARPGAQPPRRPPRRPAARAAANLNPDPGPDPEGRPPAYCEGVLSQLCFRKDVLRESTDERQPPGDGSPGPTTGDDQPIPAAAEDQPTPAAAGDEPVEISDPRALRALAHPARLTILEHLIIEGPATATECAHIAGLSPSACSYHLRALAKHGFVEEDPAGGADGRQRPWRARMVAIQISSHGDRPAAVKAAGRVLVERVQERTAEIRAEYLDREDKYSADWQGAAGSTEDVLHVTPAELQHIQEQLRTILTEYRRLGRQPRPEGARRVLVMLDFTPWFPPIRRPDRLRTESSQ